jgi:hypothetical protein
MVKKLLLFVFAFVIMGSTMAQKAALKAMPHPKSIHPSNVMVIDHATPNATFTAKVPTNRHGSNPIFTLDTIRYGASINAFGMLYQDQTTLWYDHTLDALMATFRGCQKGTVMPLVTGNDIVNGYSQDHGATWTRNVALADGNYHRYPSGVIHNPVANTDINNCYSVIEGPQTDGSGWIATYQSSVKYDGSNLDAQYIPTSTNQEVLMQGMTATEDGLVHFCGDDYATDYTSSTIKVRNGTYNASNNIDWTNIDISLDNAIARKTDNSLISFFGDAHMAWNNDGSVGYVYVRGSDNRPAEKTSWVPILFKSVDQGATWAQVDYFDFSSLTEITDWILPVGTDDNVYRPMFDESDITVDAWGKPHIFATIRGAASSNIDSLTYIWTRTYAGNTHAADNNYFEVWQGLDDQWHAHHIDTLWTDEVTATESWYTSSTGNIGWDHRLQASRSYDGTKVFATWGDSDYAFWGTAKYNLNPDLFLFGHSLVNSVPFSGPFNVTYLSDIWGISFFHFASPVAMETSPGSYEIPIKICDITSTGLSADEPVYHIYVQGVQIDFPVGINDPQQNANRVSACYPNPSSGTTSFNVTVVKNSNVNIDITNVTGQKVASYNHGVVPKGTTKLTIDNTDLPSGVYFCIVTVGDQKFTNKMIVK